MLALCCFEIEQKETQHVSQRHASFAFPPCTNHRAEPPSSVGNKKKNSRRGGGRLFSCEPAHRADSGEARFAWWRSGPPSKLECLATRAAVDARAFAVIGLRGHRLAAAERDVAGLQHDRRGLEHLRGG